jgi:hypothetical protein
MIVLCIILYNIYSTGQNKKSFLPRRNACIVSDFLPRVRNMNRNIKKKNKLAESTMLTEDGTVFFDRKFMLEMPKHASHKLQCFKETDDNTTRYSLIIVLK